MQTERHRQAMRMLLSVLLLSSGISTAPAGMYRGVDAEGNVVYSDTPFQDAEKYAPPPISVVDTPRQKTGPAASAETGQAGNPAPGQGADDEPPFRYLSFDITRPGFKETLHNPAYVPVSLRIRPGLNTAEKHAVWLLLDGRVVAKNSRQTEFKLEDVDRGVHQLQAQIRDADGKVLVRSRPQVFFVYRSSAR